MVKKLLAGEGDWECFKEVLGWIIDTEAGTIALPDCKLQELRDLLDIPLSQRRMGRQDLERLVGKLRPMHLPVTGAVAHIYHIQRALDQAGTDKTWMYSASHSDIADWEMLAEQTADRPTHLADIVCHEPTHLGVCNASGLGAGGVGLDPS